MILKNEISILRNKVIKLFLAEFMLLLICALIYKFSSGINNPHLTILGLNYYKGALDINFVTYIINFFVPFFIMFYMFNESFKFGEANLFLRGTLNKWINAKIISMIVYVIISKVILMIMISIVFNINILNNPMTIYVIKQTIIILAVTMFHLLVYINSKSLISNILFLALIISILTMYPITFSEITVSISILMIIWFIITALVIISFKKQHCNVCEKI